jgi:O-antigen/teichoic acid export membrane protein
VLGWVVAATAFVVTGGELFTNLSAGIVALAFVALPFQLWQENNNSLLLAQGKLGVLNRIQIISGVVSLALVPLFVLVFRWGIAGALAAVLANSVLVSTIGLGYLLRRTSAVRFNWEVAKDLVVSGAKLHLSAIGAVLSGQVGLLIVNSSRSAQEIAYLHLAGQMMVGLLIIPGAVSSVVYTMVARDGPDRAWPEHRRLIAQTLSLAVAAAAVAFFLAPWAVLLIAGSSFEPTVPLFRIALLTALGSTLSGLTVSQWISRGLFAPFAFFGLVQGVLSAGGTYLVVPRYGVPGVMWVGVCVSAMTVLVNGAFVVWIEKRWRREFRHAA